MTKEDILDIIYSSVKILNKAKGINFEVVRVLNVLENKSEASVEYRFPNGKLIKLHWGKSWLDSLDFDGSNYTNIKLPKSDNPKNYAIMKVMAYLWRKRGLADD